MTIVSENWQYHLVWKKKKNQMRGIFSFSPNLAHRLNLIKLNQMSLNPALQIYLISHMLSTVT